MYDSRPFDPFWSEHEMQQAKKMLKECNHLFVYGTLKSTYGNNRLLDNAKAIGPAVTNDGFALGKSGCPYAFPKDVVPEPHHVDLIWPVMGELYKIDYRDYQTASSIDMLEGYPTYYNRRVIKVTCDDVVFDAWMYVIEDPMWMHHCDACHLDNGRWVF